jgi:nicotinamide-nucleotide amidase
MESKLSNADQNLLESARVLVDELIRRNMRVVFAESCTGGLVAATLTQIPGVSSWLCGSAVTYQEETKRAWLDVCENDLDVFTAVSEQVTRAMAQGVLEKTPQADIAVAVTGHLGPNAPPKIDGVVFIASVCRRSNADTAVLRLSLKQSQRHARQVEAAEAVLRFALENCPTD